MKIFERDGRMSFPDAHTPVQDINVTTKDGVPVVTQLFCPQGDSLIAEKGFFFYGHPGIALLCEGAHFTQTVVISPYLGDPQKKYEWEYEMGESISIRCPTCNIELPTLAPHDCQEGARFVSAYLTTDIEPTRCIGICTTWGCPANLFLPYGEIISQIRRDSIIPQG